MTRFLSILLLLLTFLVVGNWLFQHPGSMVVIWLGYEVSLHIAVLILAIMVLMTLVAMVSVLLYRLFSWPTRRRMRRQQRTFKRGLAQLTRGVTALALGDEDQAEEALQKALAALPNEPLPQLLHAQLLQRQGNYAEAQLQFHGLMKHAITKELATRHVIEQQMARHEWAEATKSAEEARKHSPRDRWLVLSLIDLYARARDTAKILALTEGWQWQSPLTKEERNHFAALGYFLAANASELPRIKAQHLRHAVGYAPDFLPASVAYVESLLAQDARRPARKFLLEAWQAHPSPLLISPILASIADETPRIQQRLLKPFLKSESPLHALLEARQAIDVDAWERARTALENAIDREESKEAASLMAQVMHALEGQEAESRWLARALAAPMSEQWFCTDCATSHPQWQPHCQECGHFDKLHYARPKTGISMLELPHTTPYHA